MLNAPQGGNGAFSGSAGISRQQAFSGLLLCQFLAFLEPARDDHAVPDGAAFLEFRNIIELCKFCESTVNLS